MNALLTGASHRNLNTQNEAFRVKGLLGKECHWGPRAGADEAVTTPPGMPGRMPSAAITANRLMAITLSAGTRRALLLGHLPMMVMHSLCRTVPSAPISRTERSKGTVGPSIVASNLSAAVPPADVVSTGTSGP